MEDLEIFTKDALEFYKYLEKHVSKVDELLKKSLKPCNSILNQSLILRAVAEEDSLRGTGLEHLEKFRILLITSISDSLEKELNLLLSLRDEIIRSGDGLRRVYDTLERSFSRLRDKNSVQSPLLNPICPRLEHIVDWASDAWRCYHSLSLQISFALENLDYENEDSVTGLSSAFKEDPESKERVNKIRSYELNQFEFTE